MAKTAFEIHPFLKAVVAPYRADELHRLEVLDGYFECHDFHDATVTDGVHNTSAVFWLARKRVGGAWVVWYPSGNRWPGVRSSKQDALKAAIGEAWRHA